MNITRMFAFVASVLVTAFLFGVFAYDSTSPAHAEAGMPQHMAAGIPVSSQSAGD